MAGAHEYNESFDQIRRIAQEMFVHGYRTQDIFVRRSSTASSPDSAGLMSKRSFEQYTKKVDACLRTCIGMRRGRFITVDEMRMRSNPFFRLLKTRAMADSQIMVYFSLLTSLQQGPLDLEVLYDRFLSDAGRRAPQPAQPEPAFSYDCLLVQGGSQRKIPRAKLEEKLGKERLAPCFEQAERLARSDPENHIGTVRLPLRDGQLIITAVGNEEREDMQAPAPDAYRMSLNNFRKSLNQFADMGLLACERQSRKKVYRLSPLCRGPLSGDVFAQYPRLSAAVAFFSEVCPLGFIGSAISDACRIRNRWFVFKNRYIGQALDSLVLYDFLAGLRAGRMVRVSAQKANRYMPESLRACPIRVLDDVQHGRQYAYVYNADMNRYEALRMDYIRQVELLDAPADREVIRQGEEKLRGAWGTRLWRGQALCRLQATFVYDPESEPFIRERILREKRGGAVNEALSSAQDGRITVDWQVYDPREMIPWLLSLTCRISALSVCGESDLLPRFAAHIDGMDRRYTPDSRRPPLPFETNGEAPAYVRPLDCMADEAAGVILVSERFLKAARRKDSPEADSLARLQQAHPGWPVRRHGGQQHESPLYCGLFNARLTCYHAILRRLQAEGSRYDRAAVKRAIAQSVYACGYMEADDYPITPEDLVRLGLLVPADDGRFSCAFSGIPCRPLTTVETRWLRTLLDDARMRLFLSDDEIAQLKARLTVEPLYAQRDFLSIGAYADGDSMEDETYRSAFQALLHAVEGSRFAKIRYIPHGRGQMIWVGVWPLRLEYSRLDSKLRVRCLRQDGTAATIRLSTIRQVILPTSTGMRKPAHCTWDECAARMYAKEPIEVLLSQENQAADRFMQAFTPYKKESRLQNGGLTCRVSIWYEQDDERELIPRLLQYGKAIEVLAPERIRRDIAARVSAQRRMLAACGALPDDGQAGDGAGPTA